MKVKATVNQVLYVHPKTPMFYRFILPISLPAIMNRLKGKVQGVYESEFRRMDLSSVTIVIMDIHWYLSLRNAVALAKYIKIRNPRVQIIAGGLTASMFAKFLIERTEIDYVVRGDGEIPLPMLVNALLRKTANLKTIPNIVGKSGVKTPWIYVLTRRDMAKNNYYDIDFFPTFKKDIERVHREYKSWIIPAFPFLMPFRGCPIACEHCAGGKSQLALFNREFIVRSFKKLKSDLVGLSADPKLKFVNSYLDFVSLLPKKEVSKILNRPYHLAIRHEFARIPEEQLLIKFLDAFSGGTLGVPMDKYHVTSKEVNKVDALVNTIKTIQKYKQYVPLLYYTQRYAQEDKSYAQAVKYVVNKTNCYLYKTDFFYGDAPAFDASGSADRKEYDYYYNFSKGQKYVVLNGLARVAVFIDQHLPIRCSFFLRTLSYKWNNFTFGLWYWFTYVLI